MSKFEEKYGKKEIVYIDLEDVVFHVILPTSANRKFERAIAACALERDTSTGLFRTKELDLEDLYTGQHLAFLKTCVVQVDGIDYKSPEDFIEKYPDAVEDLYERAMKLAEQAESEAADAVGKLPISLVGQNNGQSEENSTMALPNQGG